MLLPYQDYVSQMNALYESVRRIPGTRIAIHGPPGSGLQTFVNRFLNHYKEILREQNIYCCHVVCTRRDVKALYNQIMREILNVLRDAPGMDPFSLSKLNEEYEKIEQMTDLKDTVSGDAEKFATAVEKFFKDCGETFRERNQDINIRLFITQFDSVRKLFSAVSEAYANLLLGIYDKNYSWFGVTVASHRKIAVLAKTFGGETTYLARFDRLPKPSRERWAEAADSQFEIPISGAFLGGFNPEQMREFYRQVSEILREPLEQDFKDAVLYVCGTNPHRLSIFYDALLRIADGGETLSQAERFERAFTVCEEQLNDQLTAFLKCMDDISPKSAETFRKYVDNPVPPKFSLKPDEIRDALTDMGILCYEYRDPSHQQKIFTPCIGILRERLNIGAKRTPRFLEGATKPAPAPAFPATATKSASAPIPSDSRLFHALHLSDLHFDGNAEESKAESRKAYLNKLEKKLRGIQEKTPVDYIFFTGDVAYSGSEKDYQEAETFLRRVLEICGLDPSRLLLCPGNHDQDISRFFTQYPQNQEEANKYLNLENLERCSWEFQNYIGFCKRLSCSPYALGRHESYLVGVRNCEDFTAVCLNTAWFSGRKEDGGPMLSWVGPLFLDAIGNYVADRGRTPILTVMHHPYSCWAAEEHESYPLTTNTWKKVTDLSDFILCGHTHGTAHLSEEINHSKVLNCGCLYEHPTYPHCFYSYFFSGGKLEKSVRYSFQNDEWE